MPTSHRKFGDLLEEGIKRVHINRKKPIGYILDEFGYELRPDDSSKGRYALGHWYYKKRIPASMDDVLKLAKLIVTNSDVDRDWLKAFLDSAGIVESDKVCDQFFLAEKNELSIFTQAPPESAAAESPVVISDNKEQPKNFIQSPIVLYISGFLAILAIVFIVVWSRQTIWNPDTLPNSLPTLGLQPTGLPESSAKPATAVFTPLQATIVPSATSTPKLLNLDGICPTVSSFLAFEYSSRKSFQDFLNRGGSFVALQAGFNALVQKKSPFQGGRVVSSDLNGDGVPEILIDAVFRDGSYWEILGCNTGKYQTVVDIDDPGFRYLRFVVDLNGNKLPEILSYRQTEVNSIRMFEFFVQEWVGNQIVDMMDSTRFEEVGNRLPSDITDWQRLIANATITTRDTNHDGRYEMVITGGLMTPTPTCETRFERQFTEIWAWNGKSFQFADRTYMLPIYRFQRSADGDLAFALKQFDVALKAYQDVLFDVNLFKRDQYRPQLESCKGIGPAVDASLIESEREQLEAYARWRILLINTLQGSQDAMQIVYQTLLDKFPEDKPGHAYAVIAAKFWVKYSTTQNTEEACSAANVEAKNQRLYPSHAAENICFVP
jgi:hypothetical protein